MESSHIDFETSSDLNIHDVGVYRYVEHPSTRILCLGWQLPGYEPKVWLPGQEVPLALGLWVKRLGMLSAWNAGFERIVWNAIAVRHGFPPVKLQQLNDPMVQARVMNLPASLDGAAKALGLPQRKDAEGKKLMLRMSRGEPGDIVRLGAYCKQDVVVEQALSAKLGTGWQADERRVYHLTEKINDRGVKIDREFVEIAADAVEDYQHHAAVRMRDRYGVAPTQVARILQLCAAQRVVLPDLQADTVEAVLEAAELYPDGVTGMLRSRQLAAGAAPKKFAAMLRAVCNDDRLRGMYSYYGAGQTGRWSGRIVQLHNLARPTMDYEVVRELMERLRRERDWRCLGEDPLEALLNMVRPSLIPGSGGVFTVGDESAIEARVIAWLAGCTSVLEVFSQEGGDIYLHAAESIYHRPITKADVEERRIGKVATLALGFGGGKDAFQRMGRTYGVNVQPEEAKLIVDAWRAAHREITTLGVVLSEWAQAAIRGDAVCYRPKVLEYGFVEPVEANLTRLGVSFKMIGRNLWGILPSGRAICYPNATIGSRYVPAFKQYFLDQNYSEEEATRKSKANVVEYLTPQGSNLCRNHTYSGKLAENFTQAIARDVLAEAMLQLPGAPIVLHSHDELVIEGDWTEPLKAALIKPPTWALDLPLAAEVHLTPRYWKA